MADYRSLAALTYLTAGHDHALLNFYQKQRSSKVVADSGALLRSVRLPPSRNIFPDGNA